jgi:hypothetical protein
MNPINYGSLEACKRLIEKGIVLETEAHWVENDRGLPELCWSGCYYYEGPEYPAPSMAEVWRELPEGSTLYHSGYISRSYMANPKKGGSYNRNANPTDALIDLLIWVKIDLSV